MTRKIDKKQKNYREFSNVENYRNYLTPEEFPEGSFGSPILEHEPITSSKSTPWKPHQRRRSAFVYPNKELHENLPRETPGAHHTHDDEDVDTQGDD